MDLGHRNPSSGGALPTTTRSEMGMGHVRRAGVRGGVGPSWCRAWRSGGGDGRLGAGIAGGAPGNRPGWTDDEGGGRPVGDTAGDGEVAHETCTSGAQGGPGMTWHVGQEMMASYRDSASSDAASHSLELHLVECEPCRRIAGGAVG